MKKHIPNFITLCNLIAGSAGIVLVLEKSVFYGAYFIWIAVVFDFFDGFAARQLKVKSLIGKELDSLADMVSFGVLPSVMLYQMMKSQTDVYFLPYLAFIVAAFSALRLAKFNLDERQEEVFYGLPTPANALFMGSLPFLPFSLNITLLSVVTIVFSLLLVSEIRLFSLKFSKFSWKGNEVRYSFLAVSVLLIGAFQVISIPMIIIGYILLSGLINFSKKGH